MIGQRKVMEEIKNLITKGMFPHFSIILGESGSGKKELSKWICGELGCEYVPVEIGADEVREAVDFAYKMGTKTLYVISDFDGASESAKNVLLKVTEEPPENAYFIITISSGTLETLISRGRVFRMDKYEEQDFIDYIEHKGYMLDDESKTAIIKYSTTLADVDSLYEADINEISSLCKTFCSVVGNVTLSNELKVGSKLSVKDGDGKINTKVFMKMCIDVFMERLNTEYNKCLVDTIVTTSKALTAFTNKRSSTYMEINNWIVNCHMLMSGGELF